MSKRNKSRGKSTPASANMDSAPAAGMPSEYFFGGTLCLLSCVLMSGVLAANHLWHLGVVGCGEGGACDEAAKSVWGKVPGVGLPVSVLGFSYFAALLAGWFLSAGRVAWSLRGLIWLGGFVSLLYLGVLFVVGPFCVYCFITHLANLAFVFVTEKTFRPAKLFTAPSVAVGGVFALLLGGLTLTEKLQVEQINEAGRVANAEVTAKIIQQGQQDADAGAAASAPTPPPQTVDVQPEASGAAPAEPKSPAVASDAAPFTGRYRLGPAQAPIRIVMFTDYQCPDCRMFEAEVMQIVEARPEVSLSVKHFPFCTKCNPHVPNLHGNACNAARAAEAAGMLGGNEAFWKMHRWLFAEQGRFATNEDLNRGCTAAGVPLRELVQLMLGPQTEELVKADIAEAITLGIERTPMIFVNGVELKAWRVPRALTKMVDDLAAANLPPRGPEADQPPPALERMARLWREQPARDVPARADSLGFGERGASPTITLFGDYEEPFSQQADAIVRQFVAERGGRYEFRHFPFHKDCNPALPQQERHPNACRMAAAAEVAGRLGGVEAYRRIHAWLFENQKSFSDEALFKAVAAAGLDAAAFQQELEAGTGGDIVRADAELGRGLGIRGVPHIFINGKFAPKWSHMDYPVLKTILEEAAQ